MTQVDPRTTPDPLSLLDGRAKSLDRTSWSYKLADSRSYGLDVAFVEEPAIDEKRMSLWIPYASGLRRDGVGDLLEVGGIRTERHRKNPICGFDHFKDQKFPIGMACEVDEVTIKYDRAKYTNVIDPAEQSAKLNCFFYRGKGLEGVDRRDEYQHAVYCEQLFHMAASGMVGAGSIGYQVVKALELRPDYETGTPQGLHLLVTNMLEGSLVILPANQDTVLKTLHAPTMCGKPLAPMLVKSLSALAPEQTKTLVGFCGVKALPKFSNVQEVESFVNGLRGKEAEIKKALAEAGVPANQHRADEHGMLNQLFYALSEDIQEGAKPPGGGGRSRINYRKELSPLSESHVPPARWKPGVGAIKNIRRKYRKSAERMQRWEMHVNGRYHSVELARTKEEAEAVVKAKLGDPSARIVALGPIQPGQSGAKAVRTPRSRSAEGEPLEHVISVGDTVTARNPIGLQRRTLDDAYGQLFAQTGERLRVVALRPGAAEQVVCENGAGRQQSVIVSALRKSLDARSKSSGAKGKVQAAFDSLSEEDRDGLEIWYNPGPPERFVIDQMDWHEGVGGKVVIPVAEKATNSKASEKDDAVVKVQNEGGLPDANEGWVPIKSASGKKSLDVRRKYRSTKNLRRRVKRGSPGTSVVRVRGKDVDSARKLAESKGIKFERVKADDDGSERVRLTGDDNAMDEVAKAFGLKLKSLTSAGNKAMDDNGAALDTTTETPETDGQPAAQEKWGAQMMRRAHEDHSILMKDYDDMMGVLEDDHVKKHFEGHMANMAKFLDDTESMWDKKYKDHGYPPLAGASDDKDIEGEAGDETPAEEAPEETETEPEATEADSGPLDEPTPEEAVEGMEKETKDIDPEEQKRLRLHYRRKSACPECGKENCSCGKSLKKKDLTGDEAGKIEGEIEGVADDLAEQEGDTEKALEPHEREKVGEAHGFLKELSDPAAQFGDEEKMKSYHFHKALDPIGQSGGETPAEEETLGAEKALDDEDKEEKDIPGDLNPVEEAAGEPVTEQKGMSCRKAIGQASQFFKELSETEPEQFSDEHRQKALTHHEVLAPHVNGEEQDAVGDMGEKSLREVFDAQRQAIRDLQKQFASLSA